MMKKIYETEISKTTESVRLSSIGWCLHTLGMWMDKKMGEKLEPLGLSLDQFAIIMTLLEQDCLTQVEIGVKAMLPAYATTRNLDKLESLGYVRRQKHESSRRSYRVMLTDAGNELAPALYGASMSVNELFLSPLQEEQKVELQKTLNILTDKCLLS